MFSERLKLLRKEKGITQEKLAAEIGVERSSIGKYEGKGKILPSPGVLDAIAKYFDVSVDYLLGRTSAPSTMANNSSLDIQLEGIDFALYGEVQGMTDEEKQDVLDYIQYKKSKKERLPSDAYIAAHGGAVHAPEEEKTPEAAREIFRQTRNEKNG